MAKAYIYSTLTSNNIFRIFGDASNGIKTIKASILIRGGAGVSNEYLITPRGTVTEIDEEELKLLENHKQFKRMVERGFITVEKKQAEVETVVKDMTKKDKSSPKTKDDFKEGQSPKVNEKE